MILSFFVIFRLPKISSDTPRLPLLPRCSLDKIQKKEYIFHVVNTVFNCTKLFNYFKYLLYSNKDQVTSNPYLRIVLTFARLFSIFLIIWSLLEESLLVNRFLLDTGRKFYWTHTLLIWYWNKVYLMIKVIDLDKR